MQNSDEIIKKVSDALIEAGSSFQQDKIDKYKRIIAEERNDKGKWVMEMILENACVAAKNKSPLCDDTGIPHVVIEVGKNRCISGKMFSDISKGIENGLKKLPGRPMAICGNEIQRLDQSGGLSSEPSDVLAAPFLVKEIDEDVIRVHVIMQGGGPAIRGITYRVFHKHNINVIVDEIAERAVKAVGKLGCTPCTLAIGIGRSQFEAASLMMEAQINGNYNNQSELEQLITDKVNECNVGPLGLGGRTVLATFLEVGPQRASGVRIVSMRPCCCFEPRIASIEL